MRLLAFFREMPGLVIEKLNMFLHVFSRAGSLSPALVEMGLSSADSLNNCLDMVMNSGHRLFSDFISKISELVLANQTFQIAYSFGSFNL